MNNEMGRKWPRGIKPLVLWFVVIAVVGGGLSWLWFGGAIERIQTPRVLLPLSSQRAEDYLAIVESLQSAKNALGRYPNSMEEWESVEPGAAGLLIAPQGSHAPYQIDFEPLTRHSEGIVIADPGLDPELIGFRLGVDWDAWSSFQLNLWHLPEGRHDFQIEHADYLERLERMRR